MSRQHFGLPPVCSLSKCFRFAADTLVVIYLTSRNQQNVAENSVFFPLKAAAAAAAVASCISFKVTFCTSAAFVPRRPLTGNPPVWRNVEKVTQSQARGAVREAQLWPKNISQKANPRNCASNPKKCQVGDRKWLFNEKKWSPDFTSHIVIAHIWAKPSLYLYLSSRDTRKLNFPSKISDFTHETMRAFDALNKIFSGLQEIGSLFGTETSPPSVVRREPFFGKGYARRLVSNVIIYIALTNIHLKPRLKLCHSLASLEEEEEGVE